MIRNNPLASAKTAAFVLGLGLTAFAQQDILLQGNGNYSNPVVKVVNTYVNSGDRVGLHGVSTPRANYGIGVQGDGAWRGVVGNASTSGSGTRTGVYATASGGTSSNYGVFASASGTDAWAGYFSGNVRVTGSVTQGSDAKFKKDIKTLDKNLQKVMALRPTSYHWKLAEFPRMGFSNEAQIGLIAQEVEKVIPEVVSVSNVPGDSKDAQVESYKGVDYSKLVTVLIGAIQEQQAQIEELRSNQKAK